MVKMSVIWKTYKNVKNLILSLLPSINTLSSSPFRRLRKKIQKRKEKPSSHQKRLISLCISLQFMYLIPTQHKYFTSFPFINHHRHVSFNFKSLFPPSAATTAAALPITSLLRSFPQKTTAPTAAAALIFVFRNCLRSQIFVLIGFPHCSNGSHNLFPFNHFHDFPRPAR